MIYLCPQLRIWSNRVGNVSILHILTQSSQNMTYSHMGHEVWVIPDIRRPCPILIWPSCCFYVPIAARNVIAARGSDFNSGLTQTGLDYLSCCRCFGAKNPQAISNMLTGPWPLFAMNILRNLCIATIMKTRFLFYFWVHFLTAISYFFSTISRVPWRSTAVSHDI